MNQPIEPQPYQKALNGGVKIIRVTFFAVCLLLALGLVVGIGQTVFEAAVASAKR